MAAAKAAASAPSAWSTTRLNARGSVTARVGVRKSYIMSLRAPTAVGDAELLPDGSRAVPAVFEAEVATAPTLPARVLGAVLGAWSVRFARSRYFTIAGAVLGAVMSLYGFHYVVWDDGADPRGGRPGWS
jgi:hypothetical protein